MKRERRKSRRTRAETPAPPTLVHRIKQPLHSYPIMELLDREGEEKVHQKSMEILRDIGIAFLDDPVAVQILESNGVTVKDEVAFFDPELVMAFVSKAPSHFTQLARNPDNNLSMGGQHMAFSPVYGPPYVLDLIRGRREARLLDFQQFVKLAYLSPYIHHSGGTVVEPTDEPVPTRHLDMLYSHIRYSDKAFMGSVTSKPNAEDSVRMAEIVFGEDAMLQSPALMALINASSPRRYDDRMLGALRVYAKARQAILISPFVLSGAMGPVSMAGTLAQMNAETLAGIALIQMIQPGCPVIYGSFQATIDLQSGSPTFGTPETQAALYLSAQMSRRYQLPFRSGGMVTSSKIPDAQAAYESVMTMLPAINARTNFILHAAGWLEGGLVAGYEKFVLDCEILGAFERFLSGVDLSDDAFALDSIRQVPPGGHHLGTPHTLQHFRDAFYRTELFDSTSAEQWQDSGAKDSYQRANEKYLQLLNQYEAPPMDPAVDEALLAYMRRRKSELGSS